MTKTRKISLAAVSVLLSALLILSGFMIYKELSDRQKEKEDFAELAELVQITPPEKPKPDATEPLADNEPKPAHRRDLAPLFVQNGDCIGWLSIPDTVVDYPVMHTPENPQNTCGVIFTANTAKAKRLSSTADAAWRATI